MKPTQKSKESKTSRKSFLRSWSFSSLDLLGGSFEFSLNTITGNFQTTIGSLLTLVMAGFSAAVFVLLYLQYQDTSDPVVNQSTESISKPITFNLFEGLILNPFSLLYKGRYPLSHQLENYITIKGFLVEKTFVKEENRFEYTSIQRFNYIPCTAYKNKMLYQEWFGSAFNGVLHKYVFCPDIEDFPELGEVSASPTGLSSKTVFVKIYPCSRADRTQCEPGFFPDAAAASILPGSWIPDPSNYTEPLRFSYFSYTLYLTTNSRLLVTYDVKRTRFVDVGNEYQGERLKEEYLVSRESKMDEHSRDGSHTYCSDHQMTFFSETCHDFLTIEYVPLREVITIQRNYKKLSELFGEFGGIMKIGSVLFIFYVVYNAKAKELMLAERVFGYKRQKTSRVGPKRDKKDPFRQKEAQSSPENSERTPEEIALMSVRDTLNVKNFIEKMNFMKLLSNVFIGQQNEELIDIINLKKAVPITNKTTAAKPELEHQILPKKAQNEEENILDHEMRLIFNNTGRIEKNKKTANKKLVQTRVRANESTKRWIFVDEEEEENQPENQKNRGKKLVLEPAKENKLEKNKTVKKALWTISENEQEKVIPAKARSGTSFNPKRRFKRGITPFSIRVRQKGSSSSALDKNISSLNNLEER